MSSISTPYYKALDFTLVFIGCSAAYWVRFDTFTLPLYYFLPATIFAIVSLLSLGITNFYQPTHTTSTIQQIGSATSGLGISATITVACLYLTKTGEDYSRIWLVSSLLFSIVLLLVSRAVLARMFHISMKPRMIVLLGSNSTADYIEQALTSENSEGISIAKRFVPSNIPNFQLASVADFIEHRRQSSASFFPVTEVWITHDIFSQYTHIDMATTLDNTSVALVYIPEFPDLGSTDELQLQTFLGIPTLNSEFSKHRKLDLLLKYLADQFLAWIALIVLSPLLFFIAIAIKLESTGPIFYRQTRYGFGGKDFLIWKFRTMSVTETDAEFKQAIENDPRITRVGKFLRRTSLDELPQLFNVINGTMSLVGPRPHPNKLNEQYRGDIKQYMRRHASKPGITGLAQIKGFRGETSDQTLMHERIKYDLEYVRNWSFLLDLKILALTLIHIVKTDKAR